MMNNWIFVFKTHKVVSHSYPIFKFRLTIWWTYKLKCGFFIENGPRNDDGFICICAEENTTQSSFYTLEHKSYTVFGASYVYSIQHLAAPNVCVLINNAGNHFHCDQCTSSVTENTLNAQTVDIKIKYLITCLAFVTRTVPRIDVLWHGQPFTIISLSKRKCSLFTGKTILTPPIDSDFAFRFWLTENANFDSSGQKYGMATC